MRFNDFRLAPVALVLLIGSCSTPMGFASSSASSNSDSVTASDATSSQQTDSTLASSSSNPAISSSSISVDPIIGSVGPYIVSSGVTVTDLSDSNTQRIEMWGSGKQSAYFIGVDGAADFVAESSLSAFADLDYLNDGTFGFELFADGVDLLFYVNPGASLLNKECGYSLTEGTSAAAIGKKRLFAESYNAGAYVRIRLIKEGLAVRFAIGSVSEYSLTLDDALATADFHLALYSLSSHVVYKNSSLSLNAEDVTSAVTAFGKIETASVADLTSDKPISFCNPIDVGVTRADDFYVGIDRNASSDYFELDFICFGDFSEDEFVNVVIKSDSSYGTSWALSASDLILKISGNDGSVYFKSGFTYYWTWTNYLKSDPSASEKATIQRHGSYDEIVARIYYAEVASFASSDDIRVLFAECQNNSSDMTIYNNSPYTKMMRTNGRACGDPAFQTNYVKISKMA